jgi:hypothetical protein
MRRLSLVYFIVLASLPMPAGPGGAYAALPDAAQPGRSIFVSMYGIPGAGLSLDAKFWRSIGLGMSFTSGRAGLYPGHPVDAGDESFVLEAYLNVMMSRSSGLRGPRSYAVSFIGGIWLEQDVRHPLLGLCCTYWVDEKVVVRGNAVYGPSAGAEIGYVLTGNVEATLTVLSGRGMLGLRLGLVEPRQFTPDVDDLATARRRRPLR